MRTSGRCTPDAEVQAAASRRSRAALRAVTASSGWPKPVPRPGLDLAEDQHVAVAGHDVDLAGRAAPVAVEDHHPLPAQVRLGHPLAVGAHRVRRPHRLNGGVPAPGPQDAATPICGRTRPVVVLWTERAAPVSRPARAGHDGRVPGQLDGLPLGSRSRQYARRGRGNLRDRVLRLRQRAFLIAQVAVAAAVAYWIAHDLLGHQQPFFAPVAAIISLGMSYGQRLRRVGEVTVGVAIGVLVADLFVRVAGVGLWQIAFVVAGSMTVAVLLDGGPLLVTQAAVQSVFVALVVPTAAQGFDRWVDALVGGLVALAAAAIAPQSPLRQPRQAAAAVLEELAAFLHEAAESLRTGDRPRAERTLERARATDSVLEDLRQAAAEGIEVVRQSPFRRRHRDQVFGVAALAEPLDRAVRNARVLVRRVAAATRYEETVPPAYVDLARRAGRHRRPALRLPRGPGADRRPPSRAAAPRRPVVGRCGAGAALVDRGPRPGPLDRRRPAGADRAGRGRRAGDGAPPGRGRLTVEGLYDPGGRSTDSSDRASSSTLTSLKVSTRTFLTKRAWRYMSQTQASAIVTSK